jgi:hypothetical protein
MLYQLSYTPRLKPRALERSARGRKGGDYRPFGGTTEGGLVCGDPGCSVAIVAGLIETPNSRHFPPIH